MGIQTPDITAWFNALDHRLASVNPIRQRGRVDQVIGLIIETIGPPASVGDRCIISGGRNGGVLAEVVGFRGNRVLLMPLGTIEGVAPGAMVTATDEPFTAPVGEGLLGRVLDGLGAPIDELGPLEFDTRRPVHNSPPHPLKRVPIRHPIATGIRAIDALITCGKGQRFGVFAGSGVGKSVLMGMIARHTSADVNVIALIGERGREVREFLERDLGSEGLKRSVVVAVTGDQPALARIKGAFVATTIAEWFRDRGADVMLMMDSITRFAMAQREVGLAVGEPPTSRGYTPSLFALLPKLLERAGNSEQGSITALYTVLVEGDDMNEPVADAVRSVLDGHIILSRKLASRGHYPAVEVLGSVSRVMSDVVDDAHLTAANALKRLLAVYADAEDLINIGAYEEGSNPQVDRAIALNDAIREFLVQQSSEGGDFPRTRERLIELMEMNKGTP